MCWFVEPSTCRLLFDPSIELVPCSIGACHTQRDLSGNSTYRGLCLAILAEMMLCMSIPSVGTVWMEPVENVLCADNGETVPITGLCTLITASITSNRGTVACIVGIGYMTTQGVLKSGQDRFDSWHRPIRHSWNTPADNEYDNGARLTCDTNMKLLASHPQNYDTFSRTRSVVGLLGTEDAVLTAITVGIKIIYAALLTKAIYTVLKSASYVSKHTIHVTISFWKLNTNSK